MRLDLSQPYSETHLGTILGEIMVNIETIKSYTAGITPAQYALNYMLQDSVKMRIIAIGSLLKQITGPGSQKDKYGLLAAFPNVDWSGIKGMRDKYAYNYFACEMAYPWDCLNEDLPLLEEALYQICDNYPKIKLAMEISIENIRFNQNQDRENFLESFE